MTQIHKKLLVLLKVYLKLKIVENSSLTKCCLYKYIVLIYYLTYHPIEDQYQHSDQWLTYRIGANPIYIDIALGYLMCGPQVPPKLTEQVDVKAAAGWQGLVLTEHWPVAHWDGNFHSTTSHMSEVKVNEPTDNVRRKCGQHTIPKALFIFWILITLQIYRYPNSSRYCVGTPIYFCWMNFVLWWIYRPLSSVVTPLSTDQENSRFDFWLRSGIFLYYCVQWRPCTVLITHQGRTENCVHITICDVGNFLRNKALSLVTELNRRRNSLRTFFVIT